MDYARQERGEGRKKQGPPNNVLREKEKGTSATGKLRNLPFLPEKGAHPTPQDERPGQSFPQFKTQTWVSRRGKEEARPTYWGEARPV